MEEQHLFFLSGQSSCWSDARLPRPATIPSQTRLSQRWKALATSFKIGLLLIAGMLAAPFLNATPIRWNLTGNIPLLMDVSNPASPEALYSAPVTGSFLYDASTNVYSDWAFQLPAWEYIYSFETCVTHGGVPTCFELDQTAAVSASTLSAASGAEVPCTTAAANCTAFSGVLDPSLAESQTLQLLFGTALPDGAGTVSLAGGSMLIAANMFAIPQSLDINLPLFDAQVTSDGVSAVGEPDSATLLGMGLLLLISYRSRARIAVVRRAQS